MPFSGTRAIAHMGTRPATQAGQNGATGMTSRTHIEDTLAAARGINLAWLDMVSPETGIAWRRDNSLAVQAYLMAAITHGQAMVTTLVTR
jgi:hypothetical protein